MAKMRVVLYDYIDILALGVGAATFLAHLDKRAKPEEVGG
jgi:hypothetical protein